MERMTEQPAGIPISVRDDHNCFGCGATNPWGLHLRFLAEPDGALFAHWTPAVNHQGYEGMVHGGIISTVFDEVMAWAISNAGIWAVTGRLNTTFRKPVEIGVPTLARAEIVSIQSRTVDVKATIRRESDGLLLAEAAGVFVRVSREQSDAWRERYQRVEG
jgi:acyl-coenzyme A thioesterase PaaI-like protein